MSARRIERTEARPERGETRAERPQRVPINGNVDILAVKGIKPDMHECWVNEPLVPRYMQAGYTFVDYDVSFGSYNVKQGNPLGARYARDVGAGMTAYLMEIPTHLWDADQKAAQDELDASQAAMIGQARASGLDHGDIKIGMGSEEPPKD